MVKTDLSQVSIQVESSYTEKFIYYKSSSYTVSPLKNISDHFQQKAIRMTNYAKNGKKVLTSLYLTY